MPLAALSLAGLGVALVWLVLKSFLALLWPGKSVRDDAWAGPLPPGQVRHDWLRAGETAVVWPWPAETLAWREAQSAEAGFEVRYRRGVWLARAVFGLVGCAVMAYFTTATLPFLGADFVTRKVFFLILAPLVPALYCGWLAFQAGRRLWRRAAGLPAYRLDARGLTVGARSLDWAEVAALGRTLLPTAQGGQVTGLKVQLRSGECLELELAGLSCPPLHLGALLEQRWQGDRQRQAMYYGLALSRVAGLLIPMRPFRAVAWRVGRATEPRFVNLATVGVLPPALAGGLAFRVGGKPAGCLAAICSQAEGDDALDEDIPLWQRVDLGRLARTLLMRIGSALASTYASLDGPAWETQETFELTQAPDIHLSTEWTVAELAGLGVDVSAAEAGERFAFSLLLDARLLETLRQAEQAHARERGEFASYLEREIVTAWQAFSCRSQPGGGALGEDE